MSQNATHALVHNGTPHDEVGYELSDPKSTTGEGRAKCKCGWLSEDLGTGAARREAYKRHLTEPSIDTEPTDDGDEDLIGDAPAKPAKGKGTKAADKPAKVTAPVGLADPGDLSFVDLTFEVTPRWLWPVLGRAASYALVEGVKGVGISHDDKAMKVRLAGANAKRVEATADLLVAAWEASGPARKAYKKTDAAYRKEIDFKSRGWQTRAGNLEREFSLEFVKGIAARRDKATLGKTPGAVAAGEADVEAAVKAARR